jgi:hypothetical protein
MTHKKTRKELKDDVLSMEGFPQTKLLDSSFTTTIELIPDITVKEAFKAGAALTATTVYKAMTAKDSRLAALCGKQDKGDNLLALAAIAAILIEAEDVLARMEKRKQ